MKINSKSKKDEIMKIKSKFKKDEVFFKNFDFCCSGIRNNLTLESNRRRSQVIMYDPATRLFSVSVIDTEDAISPIKYCPYCGKMFPKELLEERILVIENEMGKDYIWRSNEEYSEFEKRLPEEFKTDEWWKKRGL